MRNSQVIEAFVDKGNNCKTANLKHEDDKLISFYTTLAQRHEGKLIYNDTKYSNSTSKVQTYLKSAMLHLNYVEVNKVPMGATDLVKYIKEDE